MELPHATKEQNLYRCINQNEVKEINSEANLLSKSVFIQILDEMFTRSNHLWQIHILLCIGLVEGAAYSQARIVSDFYEQKLVSL